MSKPEKLEDNKLWQGASRISEAVDAMLGSFPEEERWGVESKLRQRSLEVTQGISEAAGAIDPSEVRYCLSGARRDLFGLKNALRIAYRRGYVKLDPQIMVDIDKLTDEIDKEVAVFPEKIKAWFEEAKPKGKK